MNRVKSGTGSISKFQNTLWSDVMRAGNAASPDSGEALAKLCRLYWYPIYAFIRRSGQARENALDLTQGFFEYFLRKELIRKADPQSGRFRSFLLGTAKNFISNERQRNEALKRGGGAINLSVDAECAEERYRAEPADTVTPEKLFDRKWAMEVLSQAVERLEEDYRRAGMSELFRALSPFLTQEREVSYAELAAKLEKNEGALRTAVNRLRQRFREIIRDTVAQTLAASSDVDAEVEYLKSVLRGN